MWQGEGWALRAVALLQLVLAGLFVSVGLGSESPNRECCDPHYGTFPLYPTTTTSRYPNHRVTQNINWEQGTFIDVTHEQQTIIPTRWGMPEEPDGWTIPTTRTTNKKKKKKTKATTIKPNRPGIKYVAYSRGHEYLKIFLVLHLLQTFSFIYTARKLKCLYYFLIEY